jgi:hypothetical protein
LAGFPNITILVAHGQKNIWDNATFSAMKKWPLCVVASLEGDNLVVFYYLSASEIWPDKRDGQIL